MRPEAEIILQKAVERLVAAAQPEQIILFGSQARGSSRPDSDLDLMVIESEPFGSLRSRVKEIGRLERALGDLPAATDLLVYSREEVELFRESKNHIVGQALREGEVLYVRP